MYLNITFEMGVTLVILAGLVFGLIKDRPADVLFVGAVVLLVALLMIGALLSCAGVSSGGGGGTSPPPINPATYKVTVTGSSPGTPANAGHTVVVTLVVN